MTRKTEIVKAIERAKRSQFKVTAIKVELEAELNRIDDFYETETCHDFIMERMARLGLAEYNGGNGIETSHGVYTYWRPILPLAYAEFYRDGSVDSEFTFTLMLNDPETVFLLPKVIKIFKDLAKANGQGMDVRGAGMHIAFLNEKNGIYPSHPTDTQRTRFYNFQKSMRMLLPALYFLSTNGDKTRGLGFRRPDVGSGTHRTAIDFRGGALEFRIFDTCYDTPEAILDNVVVMCRTMKYWKRNFVPSGAEKVASRVKFGKDNDDTLSRFYVTYTHLDLLNFGLRKLKPPYYSVGELKAQRKFNVDKRRLTTLRKRHETDAQAEFREYENRFEFGLIANRGRLMARLADEMNLQDQISIDSVNPQEAKLRIEAEVEERIEVERKRKKSIKRYVSDKMKQLDNNCGDFMLSVE